MAIIPYQYIKDENINRTGEILNFEVRAGSVKKISVFAPYLASGTQTFNVQKNSDAFLLSGDDKLVITSAGKRDDKTDADFGSITLVDGDILRFFLESSTAWNIQQPIYFIVDIDDGIAATVDIGDEINSADAKATPVNADLLGIADTEDSNILKKLSFTNLKAFLKTYFDTLYQTLANLSTSVTTDQASNTKYPSVKSVYDWATGLFAAKEIEQNSQSTAYTLVLSDAGKHIFHPSADTTARTFTIPANSSVAFPIGTTITFINQNAAGVITIAITTDTLRLAGAGTTGSRTLAPNGIATAIKITSTIWLINGTNLT